MKQMKLSKIAEAVNGAVSYGDANTLVCSVCHDSRTVQKDDIFFPIIGETHDGHKFIEDVIKNGCCNFVYSDEEVMKNAANLAKKEGIELNAVKVCDTTKALADLASYYLKETGAKVVGVTGSTGKTSTRDMTATVISSAYKTGTTTGNFNNQIGLPLTILGFDDDIEVAVLEMGMDHKGEIAYLADIAKPGIALITNIGVSHMENLGSRQGIFEAKMEITEHMGDEETLIVSKDDFLFKDNIKGAYKSIVTGEDEDCDYAISDFHQTGQGSIRFMLKNPEGKTTRFEIPAPGRHNARNAAMAAAAGEALGISMEDAAKALEKLSLTSGRLEISECGGVKIIDDTYNASPDSMKGALLVLSDMNAKYKIAVLGDMYELGENSEKFHKEIGEFAFRTDIKMLYTVGDLARYITEGFKEAASKAGKESNARIAQHFADKNSLLEELKSKAGQGDAVLFKGSRGMKMETLIEGLKKGSNLK